MAGRLNNNDESRMTGGLTEQNTEQTLIMGESAENHDPIPDVQISTVAQMPLDLLNDVLDMEEESRYRGKKPEADVIENRILQYFEQRGKVFSPSVPIQLSDLEAATHGMDFKWVREDVHGVPFLKMQTKDTEAITEDHKFTSQNNVVSLMQTAQRIGSPRSGPQVSTVPPGEHDSGLVEKVIDERKLCPSIGQAPGRYFVKGNGQENHPDTTDANATQRDQEAVLTKFSSASIYEPANYSSASFQSTSKTTLTNEFASNLSKNSQHRKKKIKKSKFRPYLRCSGSKKKSDLASDHIT